MNKLVVEPINPMSISDRISKRKTDKEVFRIGFSANYGGHTRELYSGLYLAVEEYLKNKERDYDIELLWKESSFSYESSKKAANQLINRGAEAVIGHLSANQSLAAATIYSDIGIPFFATGTTHPELTKQGYDNLLRFCGKDDDMAEEMIKLAASLSKSKSLKIIFQENNYGKQLSSLLEKTSNEKGLFIEKEVLSSDVSLSLKSNQTILYAGTYEGAFLLTKKLSKLNFRGKVIFGDDVFVADFPFLVSKDKGIQLYTISTKRGLFGVDYIEFAKKYREIALMDPGAYSITSYLATKLLLTNISVLKKYGYKKFIDHLKNGIKIDNLETISFSPNGDVLDFAWGVYKIENGKFYKL
ncbi:ABC transporter substrate-binding protein [Sediminibacillus albus]|uniref:ABC-type branched-chain amino acid transport system, substrate-binding protein n=1 Tax=Sediminibacillus albus TaxID=407036 RepID=A0A1G8YC95_9BACI|nr:ABC transporter substrate-binding protein [Sediminibacillus albus]SDK00529.1 ABC-type branched-chain amino acid transport system, substrate-binding protein [Sediminibacillus albus]